MTVTGTPLAGLGTLGQIIVNGCALGTGCVPTGSLIAVQGSGGTVRIGR